MIFARLPSYKVLCYWFSCTLVSPGKGIYQLNTNDVVWLQRLHICKPQMPFAFSFLPTPMPCSHMYQVPGLPSRWTRRGGGMGHTASQIWKVWEELNQERANLPALPGCLSPAVGFSLKIITDVTQNSGCVLWKFPGMVQSVPCKMAALDTSALTQLEAASLGPRIRKTSMKNRFQMGSELPGLLAKPGMKIIYVLIFCVFFKRPHQAFVRDCVKPCFLWQGKQALLISSKLSVHGHRRMSHKTAKTRACWFLPSDSQHGKPTDWRNSFTKCIDIANATQMSPIYQDISAVFLLFRS